jgi:hypothetical protein
MTPGASAPPSATLTCQDRPGYLYIRVDGVKGHLEHTLDIWQRTAAIVQARQPRLLMIHDHTRGRTLPPEDLERVIETLEGLLHAGLRVAMVETDDAELARMEHAVILAREAGFDVRIFLHEREAEIWLRYGGH